MNKPDGPDLLLASLAGGGGGKVNSVAISPDGRRVVSGSGVVEMWDVETGALVRSLFPGACGKLECVYGSEVEFRV
jgi:WD40 repeat protein